MVSFMILDDKRIAEQWDETLTREWIGVFNDHDGLPDRHRQRFMAVFESSVAPSTSLPPVHLGGQLLMIPTTKGSTGREELVGWE